MSRPASFLLVLALIALAAPASGRAEPPPSETLVWQPAVEPREGAFRFLLPLGWQVKGGVFRVSPSEAGGVGNALLAKCDLTLRSDDAGTVRLCLLPTWYHADPLAGSVAAAFSRRAATYAGMPVKPLPTVQGYLDGVFAGAHETVTDVAIVERRARPDLAARYAPRYEAANRALVGLGVAPIRLEAASLTVDYTEGGTRYREALLAVLLDQRAAASCWANEQTVVMRAPRAEAERWAPVFRTLLDSVQIDAAWLTRELTGAVQRSQIVLETARTLQRIDQEITQRRQRTQERIQRDFDLFLRGQEDYLDPYTLEVETDWAERDHRWVTSDGEVLYTDDSLYDPNTDPRLWHRSWRPSPPAPR